MPRFQSAIQTTGQLWDRITEGWSYSEDGPSPSQQRMLEKCLAWYREILTTLPEECRATFEEELLTSWGEMLATLRAKAAPPETDLEAVD